MKVLHSSLLGFLVLAALPAAQEIELKDTTGKTIIRYVVEVPEHIAPAGTVDPARQVGLFLCFPEHDRPTGDELLPVRESLARQGLSDRYVLLAGHPQERKFGPADHEPIEKLIAWAKRTYPINPRRVYMYGKGEGGKISGEFAMAHPHLVTASITYSWGWWTMPSELKEPLDALNSAPEFYMVLGLRDLAHHITTVRDTYDRVKEKGYRVIYREFGDLGARTYHPPSNDDAIAWATRLRNKNIPPSPEETALLKHFGKGSEGFFPSLALVGGPQAGAVVQKLLDDKDPHIRAAAAETCRQGIFGEATVSALAGKLADPSSHVRQAAIRALAANANWRSEAAQRALIELATNPDRAVESRDRVSAVDALGQAAKYQVKGVQQDPLVFRALVSLLDSKDEELRVMAANLLAPIRDTDFRGDAGRPERKSPEGGWQRWLDGITANAAGFRKDYEVCADKRGTEAPVDLYCKGGTYAGKDPTSAFKYTLQAAEQGYVPAQAAAGIMYATGKGVQQNYTEAARWWTSAAEGGHLLAATRLSMLYRSGVGVKSDAAAANKWAKFVAERTAAAAH